MCLFLNCGLDLVKVQDHMLYSGFTNHDYSLRGIHGDYFQIFSVSSGLQWLLCSFPHSVLSLLVLGNFYDLLSAIKELVHIEIFICSSLSLFETSKES